MIEVRKLLVSGAFGANEAPAELTGTRLLSEVGAHFGAPPGSEGARRGVLRSGVSRAINHRPREPAPRRKWQTRGDVGKLSL